jgi:hypothetical protein
MTALCLMPEDAAPEPSGTLEEQPAYHTSQCRYVIENRRVLAVNEFLARSELAHLTNFGTVALLQIVNRLQ